MSAVTQTVSTGLAAPAADAGAAAATAPGPAASAPGSTGMRRAAHAAVTAWVLCLIPVLAATLGHTLLRMPVIERALWQSTATQAHATAITSGRYATAAVAAISVALAAATGAGSLYLIAAVARW